MPLHTLLTALRHRVSTQPRGQNLLGQPLTAQPPCPFATLVAAELELGFALPPLLRGIYTQIANGGFGPGYGLLGLDGGFTDDQRHTAIDRYHLLRQPDPEDPVWQWPPGHLPICHWGCGIYTVVDCLNDRYPVFYADPGVRDIGAPAQSILTPHKPSINHWFEDWLEGKDLWGEVWG